MSVVSEATGHQDEEVYSLLFTKCDKEENGWAVVDDLVGYIRKMFAGEDGSATKKNEEVFDSDENVHQANYRLDLLKCMLNTHAVDGEINLVTYKYVISKWVKDIRSRSPSTNSSHSSSSSSGRNSPDDGGDDDNRRSYDGSATSILQESFETTGGGSCSNHELDPIQMMNSIAELQLEAKRLKERNEQLLIQMESSEENMKQLQAENSELNVKIRNQQQGLNQLDALKEDNAELAGRLIEGEKVCVELREKMENLQQELQNLQCEISDLQNQLTNSSNENEDLVVQLQALKNILNTKEGQIKKLEDEKSILESHLEDEHHKTESLHSKLTTTNEFVEELKQENTCLQQQIDQRYPVSSTPYRPVVPSLHEELANSDMINGMSPLQTLNSSMDELSQSMKSNGHEDDDDDLFEKLASSKAKFEEKAKLTTDGLSELIDTPLTTAGNRERTKMTESTCEDFNDKIETSLRKVQTKKKRETKRNQKLSEELQRYQEENESLRNQLNALRSLKEEANSLPNGLPISTGGIIDQHDPGTPLAVELTKPREEMIVTSTSILPSKPSEETTSVFPINESGSLQEGLSKESTYTPLIYRNSDSTATPAMEDGRKSVTSDNKSPVVMEDDRKSPASDDKSMSLMEDGHKPVTGDKSLEVMEDSHKSLASDDKSIASITVNSNSVVTSTMDDSHRPVTSDDKSSIATPVMEDSHKPITSNDKSSTSNPIDGQKSDDGSVPVSSPIVEPVIEDGHDISTIDSHKSGTTNQSISNLIENNNRAESVTSSAISGTALSTTDAADDSSLKADGFNTRDVKNNEEENKSKMANTKAVLKKSNNLDDSVITESDHDTKTGSDDKPTLLTHSKEDIMVSDSDETQPANGRQHDSSTNVNSSTVSSNIDNAADYSGKSLTNDSSSLIAGPINEEVLVSGEHQSLPSEYDTNSNITDKNLTSVVPNSELVLTTGEENRPSTLTDMSNAPKSPLKSFDARKDLPGQTNPPSAIGVGQKLVTIPETDPSRKDRAQPTNGDSLSSPLGSGPDVVINNHSLITDTLENSIEVSVPITRKVQLTKETVLNEELIPDNQEYLSLHNEIAELKEQLYNATRTQNDIDTDIDDIHVDTVTDDEVVRPAPKQRLPNLEIETVLEESFVTAPTVITSSKSTCSFLSTLLKTILLMLIFITLILMLITVLISLNSALDKCGGRVCRYSPLQMLFGQNLQFTHSGEIPM